MKEAAEFLEELSIPFELTVVSAHRTPQRMVDYASSARTRGLKVIIQGPEVLLICGHGCFPHLASCYRCSHQVFQLD